MSINARFYKWPQKKQKIQNEINDTELESTQCVKDLGVTIASNLKVSQQWKDAAGKGNRMLGFI